MHHKPDYTLRDPKGWCGDPRRGAALGRRNVRGDVFYSGKLVLRLVRLSGDYDRLGTYWGGNYHGPNGKQIQDLYWYASTDEDQTIEGHVRALSREEAKRLVRLDYPKARFFR